MLDECGECMYGVHGAHLMWALIRVVFYTVCLNACVLQ